MMTTVKIKGMTCNHCVMAVKKALSGIEGIRNVEVDLTAGTATFVEEKPISRETIKEAIERAGYEVA